MSDINAHNAPSVNESPSAATSIEAFHLASPAQAHQLCVLCMCYHLITYVEYSGCSHQIPTQRHYIDCNGANCLLSKYHKPIPHDCARECAEIMLPDQRIVMSVRPERCQACLGIDPPTDDERSSRMNGMNGVRSLNGHVSENETETESEHDGDGADYVE